MITAAIYSVLGLASLSVAVAYHKSNCLIKSKTRRTPINFWPDQFRLPFENIEFQTSDGVLLKGWFIPAQVEGRGTIILCHGWGENKGDLLKDTYFLHDLGFNLFYFDFRASGESQGQIASVGYLETKDAAAVLDFLKQNKPEAAGRIGIYGKSMGGAVAVYCASRHPEIRCMLAEDTFCSYNKVVGRWGWVKMKVPYYPVIPLTLFFVRLKLGVDPEVYSPIYNVGKIAPRPVFFIHGDLDSLVSSDEVRNIFNKAGNAKELWIVPGAGHGKCAEAGGEEYRKRVGGFFLNNL